VKTTAEFQGTDAKMDTFDFTGLENAEDGQMEHEGTEGKEINFVLEQRGQIKRGGNATTRRVLYKVISSGTPLKCVASAAGLWVGSQWLSLASIILTLPLALFVLIGEAVIVFFCKQNAKHFNDAFCRKTREDLFDLSVEEYDVYQFLRFLAVAAQVCCLVALKISVRRSCYKSQALPLEQAYKLVKPKKVGRRERTVDRLFDPTHIQPAKFLLFLERILRQLRSNWRRFLHLVFYRPVVHCDCLSRLWHGYKRGYSAGPKR